MSLVLAFLGSLLVCLVLLIGVVWWFGVEDDPEDGGSELLYDPDVDVDPFEETMILEFDRDARSRGPA